MENKDIQFRDDEGKLRPLEDIMQQIADIYKEAEETERQDNGLELCSDDNIVSPETILEQFSFSTRSLYLCDEIKHDYAVQFADAIRFWNAVDDEEGIDPKDREPIKIYIDSPGGDLYATFSIIDSIKLSKTPVWTITIGSGDSGGFFIGISGHRRFGYPNSSYLFHEGACANEGDAHKFNQFSDFYRKKLSTLKTIVLSQTKITNDEYDLHKKDDLWMTADDAVKYGVIDEIATELI